MVDSSTTARSLSDAPQEQGEKALWYMHVSGPDDVHAVPDFWTGLAWAAELNAFIAARAAKEKWATDDNWPLTQATVRRWTWPAEQHATLLARELSERQEHAAKRAAAAAAKDTDALQADLRELLTILGMGDQASAASPHEVFQEALTVLRGRLAPSSLERVRHLKRGTEYEVLGEAEAQVSVGAYQTWPAGTDPNGEGIPGVMLHDGLKLVVYRSLATGKLWCRFGDEFRDGRFKTIAPESDRCPERIAQMLEDAAAKATPSRASTYRRLAAVLREPAFAGGTAAAPAIRCGDIVLHKPSNETWTVAYADPVSNNIAWCGWPDGIARLSDCELVSAASDEQHRGTLREVIKAGGTRRAAALRLYGDPDQVNEEAARG